MKIDRSDLGAASLPFVATATGTRGTPTKVSPYKEKILGDGWASI
ncbi:hypothetical protein [Undibacterium amnicola]|nr:hypothetical protein [Undibacterium amnicola]